MTAFVLGASTASAQDAAPADAADLAQRLNNPVAALISVPLQFNYDRGYGPDDDGSRAFLNVQPVVPFEIADRWNLISRTIMPLDWRDLDAEGGFEFGVGDVTQSLFLSPRSGAGELIWGAGPVALIPSGSQHSADTLGFGPTAVALRQDGPWTWGALVNHIWDVSGDADINASFVQPFVSYTTPSATAFGLNAEATYDWEDEAWSVPLNASVSQLVQIGEQPVNLTGGFGWWLASPDGAAEGLRFRAAVTFLFPQ